ncbi:hypothetical protein OQJ15_12185 [Fluoribacter dumoffii]|uniref:Uncharacterized protein n=1 Tax=Fluoribacter dumoffii TaxID=463 RepID=A0A377G7G8_9GAMM|nr:hypothetical protein [Fluoribacter dumoffii]KTC92490.1 hypothetical protein Ldum_0296 [Fluoribacter dumoffii NY 23]MCW8387066.1 hypothetical protein [Fluoribacter dumoffii]MCW8417430.1 hypothetical protein [Fluoribacter dumoffii]MCW8461194.1 hypothetical protein [Fluoribacter dumoffii]MCW8484635.1 hypothetical protein [Fluoribacter dumoffii]
MPISKNPNERLLYCVSKGLVRTIHTMVRDEDDREKIQPEAVDQAIESIVIAAKSGKLSIEQITKRKEILNLLCKLWGKPAEPALKFLETELQKHLNEILITLIPNQKMNVNDWNTIFDFIEKNKVIPNQAIIGYFLRAAAADKLWKNFAQLLSYQQPDWRMAGQLLMMSVKAGQMDAVRQLCNLSQENVPGVSGIKRAVKEAKKSGHPEIASYLSCELLHQNNLNKKPLALTKAILQNFVDNSFPGSSLFGTQVKEVNKILSRIKSELAHGHGDNAQIIFAVIESLRKVMGSNKELRGCVDYIADRYANSEESHSLKPKGLIK